MITTFKKWLQRATYGVDAIELEQATLRLVIAGVFLIYVSFHLASQAKPSAGELQGFQYLVTFMVLGISILASILYHKNKSVVRRILGAWLDIGGTTLFMSLTAEIGVVLVGVYLFVTFGNGFRFGNRYLYHSQALSIIGFLVTLKLSPYWQNHEAMGYSLLVILIVLPLYVSQLIKRLNEAKLRAELASQHAAEANMAKTRFVANMSHEIRTPLNGIIGISTLFKTTPLNSDQQDLLRTLESSSKLLLSLLNNVLDFTKIEERKLTIEEVVFSAEEAIYDTVEIFRAQANSKGIQLGASVSNNLSALKGDVVIIRQVLANLMGNAIKFTEKGSVTIAATILVDDDAKTTVRFSVEDTGVGIPADKQGKVFDSFTQADTSTTRKFGGSGLGLTIAKHMVEAMGANLLFQSTEGVGSRFWFDLSLPKVFSDNLEASPIAAIEPISKARQGIAKPLDILVCEDESTNQKILVRLLTLPGHKVEAVSNGDEMLDALDARKYDLVITDMNMAGITGSDALKLYRFTQPDDKNTRFILFTADATLDARQAASDAGFDAFLTKPVDAATLFNTIEKIMGLAPNTAAMWMNAALNQPVETKQSPTLGTPTLDIDTLIGLEKIGANDELFMHRLLKNYLVDSQKLIANIEAAVKQKHYADLQDFCHALKGNSLSVGALELAKTTETIGKITSMVAPAQATQLLGQLNADFAKLTSMAEDYLKKSEAASRIY